VQIGFDRARPNTLRERVKNAAMISALLPMANRLMTT
jgi:hypothetical protein